MILSVLACADPPPPPPQPTAPLEVHALSRPVGWLAEQLGGPDVVVTQVLPDGQDAATWQPSGDVVASLDRADLVVANGAGFEGWLETATLPDTLVSTAEGLALRTIEARTHSHGSGGAHSHQGHDPHTWSDPALLAQQGAALHRALVARDPEHQPGYDARLAQLQEQLDALGIALDQALAVAPDRGMGSNHPSFGYLARRAGIELIELDLDPERPPGPQALARVGAWRQDQEEPVLWWEAAPVAEVQQALGSGIVHLVLDPLEQPSGGSYDYLAQARGNLVRLREAFTTPQAPR